MSASELKLKLFREIDTLEKPKLEQLYGILLNFLNKDDDTEEWNSLSKTQKKGILDAIDEMDSSEGISNESLLDKYRNKYA
jgi:hypothetical protein